MTQVRPCSRATRRCVASAATGSSLPASRRGAQVETMHHRLEDRDRHCLSDREHPIAEVLDHDWSRPVEAGDDLRCHHGECRHELISLHRGRMSSGHLGDPVGERGRHATGSVETSEHVAGGGHRWLGFDRLRRQHTQPAHQQRCMSGERRHVPAWKPGLPLPHDSVEFRQRRCPPLPGLSEDGAPLRERVHHRQCRAIVRTERGARTPAPTLSPTTENGSRSRTRMMGTTTRLLAESRSTQ